MIKLFTPKRITGFLALVAIVGVGASLYFYSRLAAVQKNPQLSAQEQVDELVDRVSKLIVLPTDEQPTMATVTDQEKLKDQPFFANAKQGYKVLIYTNARKAILYDPKENKIIEVAPLNIGSQ